ncbi:MAG: polyprenyl diphosphate synthase [candidate division WOR-3 bacterium]|nr:polyprenyl diphosphate synthase [candidate division WOR-3 bacterium]
MNKIPRHIAVIMDGNGRWAKKKGLPRAIGHQEGVKSLHEAVVTGHDAGVKYLTAYTFSTENWFRPKHEVELLMKLMAIAAGDERPGLIKNNVRVRVIGRLADLPQDLQDAMARLIADTSKNTGLTLTLALSYGGRTEIIDACRRAVEAGKAPQTEAEFGALLYDPSLPDPDLLIRTGGDRRISNYLLWQSAYTELYFTETLWPDFRKAELLAAIEDYAQRQRRFGRIDEE